MSEIKIIIALLCKHLRQLVDATLVPEHFRLAKFNKDTNDTVVELWKALYKLSTHALRELPGNILLNDYDDITFVKLYFAYLQYMVPEFYALSSDCREGSRELLLAFSWLLATKNILIAAIDDKISNSILAEEFSDHHVSKALDSKCDDSLAINCKLNRLIHICGQINYNIRSISELASEKAKLTTKAHAATINLCGLPHLSISEIGIVRRSAFQEASNDEHEQRLHELHELASVLDTHFKWEARKHVYFDWTVTVIEEHKVSKVSVVSSEDADAELSRFVCLLRHIVKKNLHNSKHANEISFDLPSKLDCVSRCLRTQSNHTETETWLSEAKVQLVREEEATQRKSDELARELKKMLKLIPHCVKI